MSSKTLITHKPEDTQNLAAEIAMTLQGGEVLALFGDLGSGKTTFTQGIAKALGIKKKVISPTFILLRSYELPKPRKDIRFLYHADLYRIDSSKNINNLGLTDLFNDKKNILLIEWPEKIESLLQKKRISIYFQYENQNTRTITIKNTII